MDSDLPPNFLNAFAMGRDELIGYLADCAGFDDGIELEVVYPGAADPTVDDDDFDKPHVFWRE
jgi:hypothetical protein